MLYQNALQGAIIIHEVYEEGAAAKDGRLWAGDQILEVIFSLAYLNISIMTTFPQHHCEMWIEQDYSFQTSLSE